MTTDIETIMGVMGNVLEWYDFAVYGKMIMSRGLFGNSNSRLILAFLQDTLAISLHRSSFLLLLIRPALCGVMPFSAGEV